jgi:hypothetical protein
MLWDMGRGIMTGRTNIRNGKGIREKEGGR